MPEPIILATWSFGKIATAASWSYLGGPNGSSLDAVEQACRAVESDLEVTSVGRGGLPNRCGEVSLDASIMQSPARCGSVCCVRRFEHPVTIARMVMERLHVVLLAGDGADRFALRQGLAPVDLLTDNAKAKWQRWAAEHPDLQCRDDSPYVPPSNHEECSGEDCPDFRASKNGTVPFTAPFTADNETLPHNRHHDTVGVLAIDSSGTLSGACSTSGLPFETTGAGGRFADHRPRTVRRSPPRRCRGHRQRRTDHGRVRQLSRRRVDGRGYSPADAAREVIQRIARQLRTRSGRPGGDHRSASLGPMEPRRAASGLSHVRPHVNSR